MKIPQNTEEDPEPAADGDIKWSTLLISCAVLVYKQ
jgi:hypothetical protein